MTSFAPINSLLLELGWTISGLFCDFYWSNQNLPVTTAVWEQYICFQNNSWKFFRQNKMLHESHLIQLLIHRSHSNFKKILFTWTWKDPDILNHNSQIKKKSYHNSQIKKKSNHDSQEEKLPNHAWCKKYIVNPLFRDWQGYNPL